jgi:hypothetical protein
MRAMRRRWVWSLGALAGLIAAMMEGPLPHVSPPRMAGPVGLGLFDGLIDEPPARSTFATSATNSPRGRR